jgi:hypothetical protein
MVRLLYGLMAKLFDGFCCRQAYGLYKGSNTQPSGNKTIQPSGNPFLAVELYFRNFAAVS